jgi:phosphate:Na+ symporter
MGTTVTLIELAGAIALLLWGLHMVQSGVQRALGPNLRRFLGAALGNRARAFAAGLGSTALLQSSTATGLMVSSFTAAGLVDLVPALAAMLGANVGTTLIVQALAFDVTRVAPVLVLIGVIAFRRADATRTRDLGRVAIGLGLMLMALQQLLTVLTPFEDTPSLRLLLGTLATDPLLDLLVAALLTWASHSSVAVVLLVMSLATKGVVPPHAAFALVMGANLGTAINPLFEASAANDPTSRRLPLGNLLTRILGCALGLVLLDRLGPALVAIEPDTARAVADFHTGFNLTLALLLMPFLGFYAKLLRRLLPATVEAVDPGTPLYLDMAARDNPPLALVCAARETLRMADILGDMLRGLGDALGPADRRRIGETRKMDDLLDRLNTAINSYLTTLDPESMSDADHRRLTEILAFATNLEHAGDVIDRNLMAHATKRLKRGLAFSREERDEIEAMLQRLDANLRAAVAAFISSDERAARQLAAEKKVFRDLEANATSAHFARLRAGRNAATETSALHLDLLRDLKRVNSHLVAAAAYPVLEKEGDLLSSRLRDDG